MLAFPRLLSALVCVVFTLPTGAQDESLPEESRLPMAALKRLEPLAGAWIMTVYQTTDDGKTWEATAPQDVDLRFQHKGLVLEELPLNLDGPGFHMRTYLSYDQYRKVYRKAALDDLWGVLDLYEGNFQGDRLVMTNLKAGTLFPVGDDRWRGFRITLELDTERRWMWVDKSDDDGASWQPAFKAEYRMRR